MKQLTQKLKSGKIEILEVPVPALRPGMVLVRNYYSLISAGTEGRTVTTARKGYIGKALAQPQQVRQVIDTVMMQGSMQAYHAVMKKLDAWSPLGYSCAGVVIDVASDVDTFTVGNLVACGGAGYANHAEIAAVPVNLCVKLAPDADLKKAAYNTLGSIALQGIRQADMRFGETCAVIGLGLIGQLTCLMLRASGIKVFGIDIDPWVVDIASMHCTDRAFTRDEEGLAEKIETLSDEIGVDAVIITAATDSTDPVNFAGRIARKKGKIVIVGNVPAGFDRNPHYYRKELELRMSCSYGPGRYDPMYEEKGIDYPVGYVRWTEHRNMKVFQEFVQSGKIHIDYLTTHVFKLDEAPLAYNMIMEKSEPYIGIMIEYDRSKVVHKEKISTSGPRKNELSLTLRPSPVSIGFIGAGSYAQSYLLPNIPKSKDTVLKGVMTATSAGSRSVADRFGFEFCTGNEDDILTNDQINTVFIATRHDTHGHYVKKALAARKHVFVEKPLCLCPEELSQIMEIYTPLPLPYLMVGFNRRFASLTTTLLDKIGTGAMSMIYRINAGVIQSDSWVQDNKVGGGRVIGEVCHFVDYLTFINGSLPVSVYAAAMSHAQNNNDTLTISLRFANGSIGSIQYFANGSKALPKEYIEIYNHGVTAIIADFRELIIYGDRKPLRKKLLTQDKGQKNEVREFIEMILKGGPPLISPEEIFSTTNVTFKILESLKTGKVIDL